MGTALALAAPLAVVAAAPAAAHGLAPADPPTPAGLLLGWSFEPALMLPLMGAVAAWLALVRRVNRAHPGHPVPRRRTVAFLGGLLAIAVALQSGIERYDTTLFSIHMIQHLLLTLVAAPLLVLGAPITLLLRAATPSARKRWILPVLQSRAARLLGHPVVTGIVFAGVMWGSHFSPLFDLALEDPLVHDLEHLVFLGAALLFWWPAVGLDPGPHRLSHPARILYTFLQMPQNTFLAVAVSFAPAPLYPHYATLTRDWGPDPLLDQQIAGAIMWVGGDLLFLLAILGIVLDWSRSEERHSQAAERRADRVRQRIDASAKAFAARRADGPGHGALDAAGGPSEATPPGRQGQ
jgi:putative copper resistance protein D